MENPKREILLQVTAHGLMAHWLCSGKPNPEIVGLFGTHILPTAWLSADWMPEAIDEIRRLNPGVHVSSI